jgi:hypothetical protein
MPNPPDDITRRGPRGYEIQYAATAWLGLEAGTGQLLVEAVEGEDAELVLGGTGVPVDLQVKGSALDVDVSDLVDMLGHFAPRRADSFLLKDLAEEPGRLVTFVMGGRVNDALRCLRALRPSLSPRAIDAPTKALAATLQVALSNLPATGATPLKTKRLVTLRAFAASNVDLADVLSRTCIVEQMTQLGVEERVVARLVQRGVPRACAERLLPAIDKEVRAARDARDDLIVRIEKLVRKHRAERIGPPGVVIARPEASTLALGLASEHVLLLTGSSQCGKTHLARTIAQDLQDKGWGCDRTAAIEDAERYVRRRDTEETVLILEDPFGHVSTVANAAHIAAALERLVPQATAHRRLIVTSNEARLRDVYRGGPPFRTGPLQWIDTTVTDRAYLRTLWAQLAADCTSEQRQTIDAWLENDPPENVFQPGHLERAARHVRALPAASPIIRADVERDARLEADGIARGWESSGSAHLDVIEALSLTSTTSIAVRRVDLAFVLAGGSHRCSVAKNDRPPGMSLGGRKQAPTWPTYPTIVLSEPHEEALDILERRGVLAAGPDLRFSHPDYAAAGLRILEKPTAGRMAGLASRLERSLSCLAPTSARVAARVFSAFEGWRSETALVNAATIGLRSQFPSVRDIIAAALASVSDVEVADKVLKFARNDESWDRAVYWREGEPWYATMSSVPMRFDDIVSGDESAQRAAPLIARMDAGERLAVADAAALIPALRARSELFGESHLRELSTYDEALVRAAAAVASVHRAADLPADVVLLFLNDRSPRVWVSVVEALVEGWGETPPERQEVFRKELLQHKWSAVHRQLAARILFHAPDTEEESLPDGSWTLWKDLVVELLHYPPDGIFRLENLGWLLEQAESLSEQDKLDVLDGWHGALVRKNFAGHRRSGDLSVARELLRVTEACPALRGARLAGMLASAETGFVARTLRAMIRSWDDLTADERQAVVVTLEAERKDSRWLKAVALTGDEVPKELHAFGVDPWTVGGILSGMNHDRLRECLSVFIGKPRVFDGLELSRCGRATWDAVVDGIVALPSHPLLDVAVTHLLSRRSEADLAWWTKRMSDASRSDDAMLFDRLLLASVDEPNEELRPYWERWFTPAQPFLGEGLKKLIKLAPVIDWSGDLRELLPKELFLDVLHAHAADSDAVRQLPALMKGGTARSAAVAALYAIYDSATPPVLMTVDQFVRDKVGRETKVPAEQELLARVGVVSDARRKTWDHVDPWEEDPVDFIYL